MLDTARLFQTDAAPVWQFVDGQGTTTTEIPKHRMLTSDNWSVETVIQTLAKEGVQSVLVEGGAQIQNAFLQAGMVDRLIVYQVPELFGGQSLS
ncbi:MAG TPA: riboflavin biosynthesis protein RibD, partial [Lactobacillus sp.]|nr:riboflavin biosynthesis protein RibD [Lactobacillus sp.]